MRNIIIKGVIVAGVALGVAAAGVVARRYVENAIFATPTKGEDGDEEDKSIEVLFAEDAEDTSEDAAEEVSED